MSLVKLSVEEYINQFPINDSDIQELLAVNLTSSDANNSSSTDNTCIPCDDIFFMDPKHCDVGKNDLDVYLPKPGKSKGHPNDFLALNNDLLTKFEQTTHENTQISLKANHILLSESVGVTMPKKDKDSSNEIEIVNGLELNYKPRYKSDYFSQDGTIRKPRYVADELGNHYVPIKVIPGSQGYIRIDWVTIQNENGIRYSMPYKFQVNNDLLDESDSNPIYAPIKSDISGLIKLYLVLIKSKQDELKTIQSLQQFPPVLEISNTNNLKQMSSLTPKGLIKKFQLEKSQLAFTMCNLSPNGETCIPDWNTTVYSTILTEISADASKKRKLTCPKCKYSFEITIESVDEINYEKVLKKRKK